MRPRLFNLGSYVPRLGILFPALSDRQAWEITSTIEEILVSAIRNLDSSYSIRDGVAVHTSARIESGAILRPPAVISKNCFIAAHAYLRKGVFLDEGVSVGPGCEIKSSIILSNSATAHFNFVGDSLLGSHVNLEAGAVIANHHNERTEKMIYANLEGDIIATGVSKFGALIGDNCRVGANAVLSPGTVLPIGCIVGRLELVDQCR